MTDLKSAYLFVFSFLVIVNNCVAQESKPSINMEAGKGIRFTSADSTFTIAIGGRIQSLFESRREITDKTTGADFLLRRCRLNFQGTAFNPKFSYRIQLGFAHGDIFSSNSSVQNNLILRDAMLFYDAKKWLRIGFGQTKLPGNRQRQVSSANLQLVERSIANNHFTLDRDKGIWFYTDFNIKKTVLKSTVAISSGEGRIVSDKNGKLCYSARMEFLPLGNFSSKGDYTEADIETEKKPKLSLAAVYSYNQAATRTMGQLGDYLYNSQKANVDYYGADLLFKYNGFSIESELYSRNSNTSVITNSVDPEKFNYVVSGTTFMVQSGYFVSKKNEIAIRYAHINPETKLASVMPKQKEYVLGFSHYFNNHNLKIQNDLSYFQTGTKNSLVFRLSGVVTF
jgi:phosphate-selective porin OprO and OprP